MMTLPAPRIDFYSSSDFTKIKSDVLGQTNKIVKDLGIFPIDTETELLEQMNLYSFALLFIGLVFNILIIMFVIISVLLIYSLLMITTETKTFDTGIMRLLGLSSSGFVAMILTQAVMFVIPSIVLAYISAYPSLYFIFKKLFKNDFGDGGVSFVPGAVATVEAVGIGLLIPAISAIIPIQRALAKTLSDSLNTARATLSGTVVIIEGKGVKVVPFIVFGLLCVIFGVTVYIVLPQALLNENLGLIL